MQKTGKGPNNNPHHNVNTLLDNKFLQHQETPVISFLKNSQYVTRGFNKHGRLTKNVGYFAHRVWLLFYGKKKQLD